MEKQKNNTAITRSLQNITLNPNLNIQKKTLSNKTINNSSVLQYKKGRKPASLVNLCLGVISEFLDDIIHDLGDTISSFPSDIKKAMAAIARRRMLLNDNVIVTLADSTWDILDLSGSDVSDEGLSKIVEVCKHLRAVDISQCSKISVLGVSELLQKCRSLEILRCGGCRQSDYTAGRCLSLLRVNLDIGEKESWEELDTEEIASGVPSLRWLIWPDIDYDLSQTWLAEFPRIILNPKPSLFRNKGIKIPREALPDLALDQIFVDGIDPKTWEVTGLDATSTSATGSGTTELSMAEKFRLAYVERDMKSAPKRAKNARQKERRAKREWVMTDSTARSLFLAAKASKSLSSLN